jgi:hypothetical protein
MIIIIDISTSMKYAEQSIYWSRKELPLLIRDKMNLESTTYFYKLDKYSFMLHIEIMLCNILVKLWNVAVAEYKLWD